MVRNLLRLADGYIATINEVPQEKFIAEQGATGVESL